MFLIFVNKLPDRIINDMLMFADNTKIWSGLAFEARQTVIHYKKIFAV